MWVEFLGSLLCSERFLNKVPFLSFPVLIGEVRLVKWSSTTPPISAYIVCGPRFTSQPDSSAFLRTRCSLKLSSFRRVDNWMGDHLGKKKTHAVLLAGSSWHSGHQPPLPSLRSSRYVGWNLVDLNLTREFSPSTVLGQDHELIVSQDPLLNRT